MFFDLGSIDIQPLDEQGSVLRICTEFRVNYISAARGSRGQTAIFTRWPVSCVLLQQRRVVR
jgi:hypothetical protein